MNFAHAIQQILDGKIVTHPRGAWNFFSDSDYDVNPRLFLHNGKIAYCSCKHPKICPEPNMNFLTTVRTVLIQSVAWEIWTPEPVFTQAQKELAILKEQSAELVRKQQELDAKIKQLGG